MKTNIYLISQRKNRGYDTYDSAVVLASSKAEAKSMHPSGNKWEGKEELTGTWCDKKHVSVELLGVSTNRKKGVVIASFNSSG